MFKEFKEFAVRGNVLDLAIGVIIGAAFGKIVTSLVDDVIMPPIGLLLGSVDFTNLFVDLSDKPMPAGPGQGGGSADDQLRALPQHRITFLIVAFVVFLIVTQFNRHAARRGEAGRGAGVKECPYCLSSIPIKATRCPHCTSELKAA